jgi:hypothetical protein
MGGANPTDFKPTLFLPSRAYYGDSEQPRHPGCANSLTANFLHFPCFFFIRDTEPFESVPSAPPEKSPFLSFRHSSLIF